VAKSELELQFNEFIMLIGVDASRASGKEKTGTENYSRNLILNLAKIDRKNNYILYLKPDYDTEFDHLAKNFRLKIIPAKRFWTQIGLSREMLLKKPDVLFVPAHILPPITPAKTVVTIHDLAWKYFPGAYSHSEIRLQKLAISRAIKKKSQIIAYSLSTLLDLKKYFNLDNSRLSFVPMGFNPEKFAVEKSKSNPLDINGPYILSVGRLETKKNIVNLIKAYILLRQERKIKEKLVLTGKPGFGYKEIEKTIESLGLIKSDVIITGYVSDDDLRQLYVNASIFVFPSLYEGFGFPILEAFASGVPVVTSSISSMPEIAGNAALLVNPKKPFEITAAISQILNKPALKKSLISKGKARINLYSWETCAKETLKVLTGMDD